MRWVQDSHHGDCIIVEHGGNIFGREFIRRIRDKEASLPHSTITDNDTSVRLSRVSQGSRKDIGWLMPSCESTRSRNEHT